MMQLLGQIHNLVIIPGGGHDMSQPWVPFWPSLRKEHQGHGASSGSGGQLQQFMGMAPPGYYQPWQPPPQPANMQPTHQNLAADLGCTYGTWCG
jgi:hypothetical protein